MEGIFRLNGAEKRIKELVVVFNSPDRYGKGLDWDGYTVHDAANVLRRYLNQLPEPIIPLDLYERFREPLRGHALEAVGDQEASHGSDEYNEAETIIKYQQLITELPPLNRQLLLYILDLLAVFASKSDENRMTSQNLAAIFQPGMLTHPAHDMAPAEYRLSQNVLVFLIENQDHFIIGMGGTAADELTVQDVQNGKAPPPPATLKNAAQNREKDAVARPSSDSSAESIRRQGHVRRNVSVNSKKSWQSNGLQSPTASQAQGTIPRSPSGGLHRSNTVPSKKSPRLPSGRSQKTPDNRSPTAPVFSATAPGPGESVPDLDSVPAPTPAKRDVSPISSPSARRAASGRAPAPHVTPSGQSRDRLRPESLGKSESVNQVREQPLLPRSPTTDSDRRQPNKLRKRRIPGSSNPSAQSSTNSLQGQQGHSGGVSPRIPATVGGADITEAPALEKIPSSENATPTRHTAVTPAVDSAHLSRQGKGSALKPQVSSNSLQSPEDSANDHSDPDHVDDPVKMEEQKEKPHRWRLSRRHDTPGSNAPHTKIVVGSNGGPEASTTSFHSGLPRKSMSGEAAMEAGFAHAQPQVSHGSGPSNGAASRDHKEEKKGPIDWLKTKMREVKEEKREKDKASTLAA